MQDANATLTIVWFRQDLRLDDNPALAHAAELGAVLPVFIDTTDFQTAWVPGAVSRWWLGQSLHSLDAALQAHGSRLILARGDAAETLLALARKTGAQTVLWNNRYEPTAAAHDAGLKERLRSSGLQARSYSGRLLHEPWEVRNEKGGCYKVFTPYWNRAKRLAVAKPLTAPKSLVGPTKWPRSVAVDKLPATKASRTAAARLAKHWQPGEGGAEQLLRRLDDRFAHAYPEVRDMPTHDATSRLSPHLHFGEVSPNRIYDVLRKITSGRPTKKQTDGVEAILRQLGWRDFTYHLLYHFPHTPDQPLREEFANVRWRDDSDAREAWTEARTGYPIVDD